MKRRFLALPALAALAGLLCTTGTARAAYPSPANCTVPVHVNFVGSGIAGPDTLAGHVTVTYRDIAYNPVPGIVIGWDFSQCTDLRIAADPLDPRLTVRCNATTVSAVTGPDGVAPFTFLGGGRGGVGHGAQLARVFAIDGFCVYELRTNVTVAAYDLDGTNGVDPLDLARWSADYFTGSNPGRADYDGNGELSGLDLSRWGAVFFSSRSRTSPAAYCP